MRHRTCTTTAVAAVLLLTGAAAPPASGQGRDRPADTYTNPVSAGFADTFADPAVVRGKDGWWYAVATTDPLREGESTRHIIPTARSADLVEWEHVGDAFTQETMPAWADTDPGTDPGAPRPTASIWAADLRYVDGEYRLYYVVTETNVTDEPNDNAIGVATADSPAGPWTDSGAPVIGPRRGASGNPGDFLWTFDPTHVRADDGSQHLFYGSYYGGIWTVQLDKTGTRATGTPVQVTIDNKYEGAYVLQRDGWWYLFVSSANCCNGPATGYSVHVGRSRGLTGPFVDRQGVDLLQSRAGGTPVLAANGNKWIGAGHNAVVTDLAGQDWIVYHAIDRADPYLDGDEIGGINERPMVMDRMDWSDGWPTARAGEWASDGPQPAPLAAGRSTVAGFDDGVGRGWRADRGWTFEDGVAVSTRERTSRITRSVRGCEGVRVEADVRVEGAPAGLSVGLRDNGSYESDSSDDDGRGGRGSVQAVVDAGGTLSVSVTDRRGTTMAQQTDAVGGAAQFDGGDWHSLALVVSDGVATAQLSDARLGDPLAQVRLDLDPRAGGLVVGRAGALALGAGAQVDNLSVAGTAEPVPAVEPAPLGELDPALSDEFDEPVLDGRWQGVRDPQVSVAGGRLSWPVQNADLGGPGGAAALLLQEAPAGDWTIETSVDVSDLGVDEIRNFQQGGLIVHVDDDRWVRLSTVAIWNTRQNEFGTEMPWPPVPLTSTPVTTIQGGTIVGPPGAKSWLRISRTTNPDTGELLLTPYTSNDGTTWVRGGTWTLPAGSVPRVGLFSGGGDVGTPEAPLPPPPPAEMRFDHVRWYLP